MNHRPKQIVQTIQNLQGEIAFREKLSRQHVFGENILPDYYQKEQHDQILLQRMADTLQRMEELVRSGVSLSPFLELGAERGQRSLVLTNDFNADGVAVDISFHQLKTMDHFANIFQKEKLPVRVCCDANHLPFRNHSFPFIFCYEFLHHFPSLSPVIREVFRVLSTGHFFFAEEPFRRWLKVNLYKQNFKIYSEKARSRNRYLTLLDSFVSEPQCDETAHGIIENNEISLAEWCEALAVFEEREIALNSIHNISSRINRQLNLRNLPNFLLGGSISGLCHKFDPASETVTGDIFSRFGCPDCMVPMDNGTFDRPALIRLQSGFQCPQCGFNYPWKEGIIFLLPKAELQQLYPGI